MKRIENRLIRILLLTAGTTFVGLGIIGIFIPLMPTTVFFLMAAWCYVRSSEKMYHWLLNNSWFGPYIKNFLENRSIPLRAKILAITMIWVSIGFSIIYVDPLMYVKVILLIIATLVTGYLLSIKTLSENQSSNS